MGPLLLPVVPCSLERTGCVVEPLPSRLLAEAPSGWTGTLAAKHLRQHAQPGEAPAAAAASRATKRVDESWP